MSVSKAREEGSIKRRNIMKLDKKVNEHIVRYLQRDGTKYNKTLPEQMLNFAKRKLPQPTKSFETKEGPFSAKFDQQELRM